MAATPIASIHAFRGHQLGVDWARGIACCSNSQSQLGLMECVQSTNGTLLHDAAFTCEATLGTALADSSPFYYVVGCLPIFMYTMLCLQSINEYAGGGESVRCKHCYQGCYPRSAFRSNRVLVVIRIQFETLAAQSKMFLTQ